MDKKRRQKENQQYVVGTYKNYQITSFLSKAHNWKSPGSHQIQNYWLKAFPVAHSHITKNVNAIMEEPEKVPDRLTTGVTYMLPKSGDSKAVRN
jgi:hypothetical protein